MNYISNPNLKNTSYTPPQGRLPTETELIGVRTKLPAGNPWRDTDHGYIFSQEEMDDIFPAKKSKISLASYPNSTSLSSISSTQKSTKLAPQINTNNSWEYNPIWNDVAKNVDKATKGVEMVADLGSLGQFSKAKKDIISAADKVKSDGWTLKSTGNLGLAIGEGSARVIGGAIMKSGTIIATKDLKPIAKTFIKGMFR